MQTQETRQQILRTITAKVLMRLQKLQATEEKAIRQELSDLPQTVVTEALKEMAASGLIRRIRTRDQITLIARKKATKAEIAQAAQRVRETRKAARINRNRNRDRMAREMDDREMPHYSEKQTFGLSYEQAMNGDYDEAEIKNPALEREIPNIPERPIGDYQQALIRRQLKTGQGFRNAARARKRYIEKERQLCDFLGLTDEEIAEARKERAIARAKHERELLTA